MRKIQHTQRVINIPECVRIRWRPWSSVATEVYNSIFPTLELMLISNYYGNNFFYLLMCCHWHSTHYSTSIYHRHRDIAKITITRKVNNDNYYWSKNFVKWKINHECWLSDFLNRIYLLYYYASINVVRISKIYIHSTNPTWFRFCDHN